MTVAELIAKLQEMPQELPVVTEKGYMQDLELVDRIELQSGEYCTPEMASRQGEYVFIN